MISREGLDVTIPFAGFYCSEEIFEKALKILRVTIPFAGFYCSESVPHLYGSFERSHNPVRGILLF